LLKFILRYLGWHGNRLVMHSDKIKFKNLLFVHFTIYNYAKINHPYRSLFHVLRYCCLCTNADGSDSFADKFEQANVSTHVGAFARLKLLGFFVQPEIVVTSLKDMDIPLMFGTKLGPARVMAGPYVRMAFDRNALADPQDRETMLESARYGYQAGVGLDLGKRLIVDLRYEGNLSNLSSSANVLGADRPFDTGDPQIILSVGYSLTGGSSKKKKK